MNQDTVKGAIDELVGSAKRTAGDLTGDTSLQFKGMAQQVHGKIETAWGKAKEAVEAANEEAAVKHESRAEVELECAAIEDESRKSK